MPWDHVKRVLWAALEQPPAERAAFLRDTCGGNEKLRVEVESLLIAHSAAASFADRAALDAHSAAAGGPPPQLQPRHRLGPYEIVKRIGVGGMGEVYKARDTRLNRVVAIKVLPEALASDPQFQARFEREASTISQLDHPHICTIHDVGEQNGIAFLVMQYLEGETLEDRLKKGPLSVDQALKCAVQIADALDAAHRRRDGITHRDLKPANVMLTRNGAKLLDFGIAKLRGPATSLSMTVMTRLATISTGQGMLLGTLHYMAPEQVEGREADARSDIFALGVTLYEMVTGTRPFDGEAVASVIGAILKDDPPPISTRQPLSPRALDHVVRRCLAKDPEMRWQTARDLREELAWVAGDLTRPVNTAPIGRSRWRDRLAWLVAATAVAVLSIVSFVAFGRAAPELPVMQLDVLTPPTADPVSFAISPDGRQLVFVATTDTGPKLWLRPLSESVARPLAGTDGAIYRSGDATAALWGSSPMAS
jgi:serine/threonine protein kinase